MTNKAKFPTQADEYVLEQIDYPDFESTDYPSLQQAELIDAFNEGYQLAAADNEKNAVELAEWYDKNQYVYLIMNTQQLYTQYLTTKNKTDEA